MSANIDTMMYVGETPWHKLGHQYTVAPSTPQEIVTAAQMDWRVNVDKMYSSLFSSVPNYYAVYREDNSDILGVVNKPRPNLVQNIDAFNAFGDLLGKEVSVETAASLGRGERIFGCFKIDNDFTVLDDKVEHYFVVLNEHLKADGRVTIMNTPIRVVCQNTLSAALSSNDAKMRIPISADNYLNAELARKIISGAETSIVNLNKRAEKLATQKVSDQYVETVLDNLFPFIESKGDESLHTKANEKMAIIRETFMNECMDVDNLANYRGTKWQIVNAVADFSQHYFNKVDKAYDLNYRMNLLPGMGATDGPATLMPKYLKIMDKIAA